MSLESWIFEMPPLTILVVDDSIEAKLSCKLLLTIILVKLLSYTLCKWKIICWLSPKLFYIVIAAAEKLFPSFTSNMLPY